MSTTGHAGASPPSRRCPVQTPMNHIQARPTSRSSNLSEPSNVSRKRQTPGNTKMPEFCDLTGDTRTWELISEDHSRELIGLPPRGKSYIDLIEVDKVDPDSVLHDLSVEVSASTTERAHEAPPLRRSPHPPALPDTCVQTPETDNRSGLFKDIDWTPSSTRPKAHQPQDGLYSPRCRSNSRRRPDLEPQERFAKRPRKSASAGWRDSDRELHVFDSMALLQWNRTTHAGLQITPSLHEDKDMSSPRESENIANRHPPNQSHRLSFSSRYNSSEELPTPISLDHGPPHLPTLGINDTTASPLNRESEISGYPGPTSLERRHITRAAIHSSKAHPASAHHHRPGDRRRQTRIMKSTPRSKTHMSNSRTPPPGADVKLSELESVDDPVESIEK